MILFAWLMVVVFGLIAILCGAMVFGAANNKSGGDFGQVMNPVIGGVFLVAGCLSATAAATIAILASR